MNNLVKARALSVGAVWKKWDLHVHTPGTRLNDQYKEDGKSIRAGDEHSTKIWNRYCKTIYESDVEVIGITDYFTFDSYFEFLRQYKDRYPECNKIFLPNLEVRLPEAVNRSGKHINLHLIFPETLSEEKAKTFLSNLKLTEKNKDGTRKLNVAEVQSYPDEKFRSFTVNIESCIEAIKNTFDGITDKNIFDAAFLIVSGREDGVSPGEYDENRAESKPRNEVIIDEIDQLIHGVFARSTDRQYWLDPKKRNGGNEKILVPHPTFSGCDAHCFDELEHCLGKSCNNEDYHRSSEITWVKAVPSWNGLLQTLVEPESRVLIQVPPPFEKNNYFVIDKVLFNDNERFPECIRFNPGLNAIIGSRSSGKSSLLAHIAHAISPEKTELAQVEAGISNPGPAAGFEWKSIEKDTCIVNWRNEMTGGGAMVYVPQNYLTQLNTQPDLVTRYVIPAIEVSNDSLYRSFEKVKIEQAGICNEIERLTCDWFQELKQSERYEQELSNLPSRAALQEEVDRLKQKINSLRAAVNLSESDFATHINVSNQIENLAEAKDRYGSIYNSARALLSPQTDTSAALFNENLITLDVRFGELENHLPQADMSELRKVIGASRKRLQQELTDKLLSIIESSKQGAEACSDKSTELLTQYDQLFQQVKKNADLNYENTTLRAVEAKVKEVEGLVQKRDESHRKLTEIAEHIESKVKARRVLEEKAVMEFNNEVVPFEERIKFKLEVDFPVDALEQASEGFDKKFNSTYLLDDKSSISLERTQGGVKEFLNDLANSQVKFKKGFDAEMVAKSTLKLAPEFRFAAEMDGDRIGGFNQSTMTPGKQALFALTLILSDAGHKWPLLIDQPEDDLDSKSIYTQIVEFLKAQKNRRQIIMVTHNANLVVGADAELVIVANRHGDDRPNEGGRTFDYLSGALEDAGVNPSESFELDKLGIREHVVEILDGGEEAFRKRRQKYKL